MEVDLELDRLGELREPDDVLLQIGGLAQGLAEHEFVVDQVERQLGIVREDGESLEVPFRRDANPRPPSVPLVGAEHRGELGRLEVLLFIEERGEVRAGPILPEPQEAADRRRSTDLIAAEAADRCGESASCIVVSGPA